MVEALLNLSLTFTYWPEMLNFPYFMAHGLVPYRDFAMVFTPLLPVLIFVISSVIGFGPSTIHLIGISLLIATDFLLIGAVYKDLKSLPRAVTTGLVFIYLAIAFESNHLWPDSLLTPFIFLILYSRRHFLKGLFFFLAILTKQTTFYILPLFLYFPLATLLPAATIAALLFIPGFYFWAVKFVFLAPGTEHVLLPTGRELIFSLFPLLTAVAISRYAFFWIFFLTLFIYPRFGYFHLEPLLVVWLFFLATKIKTLPRLFLILILVCLFYLPLFRKTLRFQRTYLEADVLATAFDLKINYKNSSLAIINAPEQIYFLSDHLPAVRPWVEQLPWVLKFAVAGFTTGFLAHPPDLVLYQPFPKPSPIPVIEEYIKDHYATVKTTGSYSLMARKSPVPTSQ